MSRAQVVIDLRVLVSESQSTLEFFDSHGIILLGEVKNTESVMSVGVWRFFRGLNQAIFNTPQTVLFLRLRRAAEMR